MTRQQLRWRIAVCESGLDPTAKFVALVLDTWMSAEGFAWPSKVSIAARASLGLRTVDYAVDRLEQAGFLTVAHSNGRVSNRYLATVPPDLNPALDARLGDDQPRSSRQPTPHLTTANPAPGAHEAVRKPSEKPPSIPRTRTRARERSGFIDLDDLFREVTGRDPRDEPEVLR